jgi:hypothetical protein
MIQYWLDSRFLWLLNDAYRDYIASDVNMTDLMVFGNELEGSGSGLIEVRPRHLSGWSEEKNIKTSG